MDKVNNLLPQRSSNVHQLPTKPTARIVQPTRLDDVLQGGTIGLEYQPQFDLATGAVRGIEALLRVRNSEGQKLNPGEVIDAAEQQDLVGTLGYIILTKACADFAAMRSVGCDLGQLAVNVSPLELRQPNYAELVMDAITAAGLAYSDVELEITEGWPLTDPSLHLDQLATLSNLGISIALDDFGTGHANWVNVLKLPIRTLKIDRSLITDLEHCERTQGAVRSICKAATEIGFDIIAEGVCNAEQRNLLLQMGCQNGQGFGLGMPMTAASAMDITPLTFDSLSDQSATSKTS